MEQRNMILAFVLSMLVLVGWGMLFPPPEEQRPAATSQATTTAATPAATTAPALPAALPAAAPAAIAPAPVPVNPTPANPSARFTVNNDLLSLIVDGHGRFTSARISRYRESLDAGAQPVKVLGDNDGRLLIVNSGPTEAVGTPIFVLTEKGAGLLVLRADLGNGNYWERRIHLEAGSYLVQVEDVIPATLPGMFHQVVESHPNKDLDTFYEHSGPVGLVDNKLLEPNYDDLDSGQPQQGETLGGWVGVMNRYFMAAIVGDAKQSRRYYYKADSENNSYQAGMLDAGKVLDNQRITHTTFYIGPKTIPGMEPLGFGLDRSVDFGWFSFIAKPMHEFLVWLYGHIGNYGVGIILLVVLLKIIFFYPTMKSFESMAGMRKLQPEMERLKTRFGDDRQKLGEEMMGLYKKHKVNPLGGCLPIIIQIPVFFALYKVLLMSIEMRHAPFYGWIHDLSYQDPFYVLPLLMGATMFIQQKLNPQPPDPLQAKIMQFLPLIFTVMFLFFPAGLVLYWVVNNTLSIIQQYYVLKVKKAL